METFLTCNIYWVFFQIPCIKTLRVPRCARHFQARIIISTERWTHLGLSGAAGNHRESWLTEPRACNHWIINQKKLRVTCNPPTHVSILTSILHSSKKNLISTVILQFTTNPQTTQSQPTERVLLAQISKGFVFRI